MTWVTGDSDTFMGFPLTQPIIQVLDGRKLGPGDVMGRTQYPLQDALDGAAVKPLEDLRTHAKYFQSPNGESPLGGKQPSGQSIGLVTEKLQDRISELTR